MQISGIDMKALELLAEEDPELAAKLALDYRKAMTVLARSDPSWFCQYVLRHEDTGAMIYQTPMHHEIHKTILASPRTLVWTYPGMGKCCASGSPVLLADGSWKPVEELREWTPLLTWDGHSPELKEVTGRSTPNGKRRCHRIELSNGALLYLTEHHPLLREDFQWTQARFLRAGDKIYGIGRLSLSGSGDFSVEEAEILGYLLGGRVLGKDVILRKINRSKKWSARREDLLCRAGWKIREHGRLSFHSFII